MSEHNHEQLADELDREADKLAEQNARLSDEIDDVRDDWARKQQDEAVPGAVVPDDEAASEDRPDPDSST